jgi:uncharacterized protein (DUF58 family)
MIPTPRALWLLAAGAVVALLGLAAPLLPAVVALLGLAARLGDLATAWLAQAVWLALGLDAGVLALLVLDALLVRRLTRAGRLSLRRERPARLSLGVANDVVLHLTSRSRRPLHLLLRDTPPADFPAEPELIELTIPARGSVQAGYRLLPTQRGDCSFGDVHVRIRGPLGLASVDRVLAAAESVPVYPNLLEVRRYEALVRCTLVRTGGYRTARRPGTGREFSHHRDWTPDDDYRHVSWKATARRHRPTVSVFESEHSQDVIFCLDVGRMMAVRLGAGGLARACDSVAPAAGEVGSLTKLDCAINAILMLAHVSQTFQDNLGLLLFSHTVHLYLPPGKGQAQHAQLLQALYRVQPEYCHVDYREAFAYLIARHPKRALTLVFTDLLDAETSHDFLHAASLLKRFHLPLTLAVADVPLQQLAEREPEDTASLYDVLVARDLLRGRAEMLRQLERQGVLVVDTVPEHLTVDAVNRYLALKTGLRM